MADADTDTVTPCSTPGVTHFGAYHRPMDGHFSMMILQLIFFFEDNAMKYVSYLTSIYVYLFYFLIIAPLPPQSCKKARCRIQLEITKGFISYFLSCRHFLACLFRQTFLTSDVTQKCSAKQLFVTMH